jgi:hypothetical protein
MDVATLLMLIQNFEKLTSGKLISRIVFADGEVTVPWPGMKVRFADDDENADAWICHDETGIWLSSNAHVTDRSGYLGFRGFEQPLSAIATIVFAGD